MLFIRCMHSTFSYFFCIASNSSTNDNETLFSGGGFGGKETRNCAFTTPVAIAANK